MMKSGASCGVNSLSTFSFFVKVLPFMAKFVRSESLDAVKSGASCGVNFLPTFSFFVKALPFVAKFVLLES